MKKPIAKICPNGTIKFYHADGTRNKEHSTGFYHEKNLSTLKKDYNVIFS